MPHGASSAAVILVIMVMFTLGLFTRITSVLTWMAAVSFIHRNPQVLFGQDTMMNILLIYLIATNPDVEGEAIRDIEVVSTGSLGLDIALGVGGLPRGRVVEIYGPESSGKTTIALQAVAEAQKAGGMAAFIPNRREPEVTEAAFAKQHL